MKKKKRVFYSWLTIGWHKWEIYGMYGILDSIITEGTKESWEKPVRIKVTVEEK